MEDTIHDEHGRFVRGNPGGPGRPARQTEREYLAATLRACTLEDWEKIVERATADAKGGDCKAREWLGRYLLGLAEATAPRLQQLAIEIEAGVDPLKNLIDLARFMP